MLLSGNTLYAIFASPSHYFTVGTIQVYSVSNAGLSLINQDAGVDLPGYEGSPVASVLVGNYLYFVSSGGGGPSPFGYLDVVQTSSNPMQYVVTAKPLSCTPRSAALDSAASLLFINCGTSVEIFSVASPTSPVEVDAQSVDSSVVVVGN